MTRSGLVLILCGLLARPVSAQRWNDPGALALVERAIGGRRDALADTSLRSWAAVAHGIVTFSTELLSGAPLGPRVSKGDELVVEVYWERPDRSKQVIVAWRDSTFFPTNLAYHRDHLALVSDDVGATIRIGGGDEVADLAHPLSAAGREFYDFRVLDTVRIDPGTGPVALVRLEVRPRDPAEARVVGTLLLDLERAEVVRSVLSFTRAAYRDPTLEDIAVRLERSLVDGRHWLPYRQEIEIRRRSAILDFPLRTVIRGQWEVDDYRLNAALPTHVTDGPPIGGLRTTGGQAQPGVLAAAIDSGLAVMRPEDFAAARNTLVAAWRGRLRDGLPGLRLSAGRLSDVARVNRVEGLRLGAGLSLALPGPFDRLVLVGGYGFGDERVTGAVELVRRTPTVEFGLRASRGIEDVGDHPGASGVLNSLTAQEGGRDLGHYILAERLGARASGAVGTHARFTGIVDRERTGSVGTTATPVRGQFGPNPALGGTSLWVVRLGFEGAADRMTEGRWRWHVTGEVGVGDLDYGRLAVEAEVVRPGPGGGEWRGRVFGGVGSGGLPAHRQFAWGGPGTVVGLDFRQYSGRAAAWGLAEVLWPVGLPAIGLGRWGRLDGTARLGPFVAAGWAGGTVPGPAIGVSPAGLEPVVGLAAEVLGRFVRIEAGQCLKCGLGPRLAIDLQRVFWQVL